MLSTGLYAILVLIGSALVILGVIKGIIVFTNAEGAFVQCVRKWVHAEMIPAFIILGFLIMFVGVELLQRAPSFG